MDYVFIQGFQSGTLLYVPSEKHLYLRKSSRNGIAYFVCYDTVITKKEKSKATCFARCHIKEKTCTRNAAPHTHHDHEIIYNDLVSLNAMKNSCRLLAEKFPLSAKKIPIKEIFLMEMSKWVIFFVYVHKNIPLRWLKYFVAVGVFFVTFNFHTRYNENLTEKQ